MEPCWRRPRPLRGTLLGDSGSLFRDIGRLADKVWSISSIWWRVDLPDTGLELRPLRFLEREYENRKSIKYLPKLGYTGIKL